ncbi:MAG: hypothetical protein R3B13_38255 [Polyangiaceae bacterium]
MQMGIPRRRSNLRGVRLGALTADEEVRVASRHARNSCSEPLGCSKLERMAGDDEPAPVQARKSPSKYDPAMGARVTCSSRDGRDEALGA